MARYVNLRWLYDHGFDYEQLKDVTDTINTKPGDWEQWPGDDGQPADIAKISPTYLETILSHGN